MAVTYAALVSIVNLMDQIQSYHSRRPIFLDKQLRQLECIQQIVIFFQDFLEVCPHESIEEAEGLRIQITGASYAIEYIIEFHMIEYILVQNQKQYCRMKMYEETDLVLFTSHGKRSSPDLSQCLQRVIEDMEDIKREVMLFKETLKLKDHKPRNLAPTSEFPHAVKDTMVESDDDNLVQIMEKLTRQQPSLQIITITGMGGIGKTTLAKNVYSKTYVMNHFEIRGWITISQEYNVREMLLGLLNQLGVPLNKKEKEGNNEYEFGEKLHKHLFNRRYIIVLDDMWSMKAWDSLNLFFPKNDNGCRIIVTTRLSNIAKSLDYSNPCEMKLLDKNKSWSLLRKSVFLQEDCPPELEEVGRRIATNCKGLPLSIVVIGGLLAKSNMTPRYWESIADDISTTINSEDDERYLSVLYLSYNHMSIHLKPCFLYMGVYSEDHNIRVSELIKRWVAEGFLKPDRSKSLEEVAIDYLNDLIDRNLIFVSEFGSTGSIKYCKIHDLLRDLCLRESCKERTFCAEVHNLEMNIERRPGIPLEVLSGLHLEPPYHSFTCCFKCDWRHSSLDLDLGRENNHANLVSSRYLGDRAYISTNTPLLYLWNLQTITVSSFVNSTEKPTFEIWDLLQLRHLNIPGVVLSDPPCRMDEEVDFVLENLQSLSKIENFRCTEEVLKRIPNIKKLKISYSSNLKEFSHYCLNNLDRLDKLQSLYCEFNSLTDWPTWIFLQNINFSDSLKKLTLQEVDLNGGGIMTKIGSLSHLEKLKLKSCFVGEEWNPVEGQFLCLKYLEIYEDYNLVDWTVDNTHFPCLECLVLSSVQKLNEIPSDIGETTTLRLIKLLNCSRYVVTSAKEILKEQQSNGNEDFHLVVQEDDDDDEYEYEYDVDDDVDVDDDDDDDDEDDDDE